ncbi:MAG: T9SS type A sorting domain-containing protein [Paludibacter sp.]|nr:T9SS type A sorting domain-containing protein [Paludibacter sp.]
MKKITLLVSIVMITVNVISTNLVTNPGFEAEPSGYTVVESSLNVLMRVANHQDAITQTASPTAPATAITDGMWVRKSPNSGYIKGVIRTDLTNPDGSVNPNSCLNLRINQNATTTGLTNWYQTVAQQRIAGGLNVTKKYAVKFKAKIDNETSPTLTNVCDKVVVVIRDITNNLQTTQTISVTTNEWTEYSRIFDLPAWVSGGGAGADCNNVILGFGISTTYGLNDDPTKTNYSSILIDNIELVDESMLTGYNNVVSNFTIFSEKNTLHIQNIKADTKIAIYDLTGNVVYSKISSENNLLVNNLSRGIYLVKAANQVKKVVVD